jgi:RHS repeat-associated protein
LDSWFRDSTQKINNTSEVKFEYDDDGLLVRTLVGTGGITLHRRTADGLLDSTKSGSVTSSVAYDALGQVKELHYSVAGTAFFHQQLNRDEMGRVTGVSETINGQTHTMFYRYNGSTQLDSVALDGARVANYEYDGGSPGNGNRSKVTGPLSTDIVSATYDAQDRLLSSGNAVFSYSANGDLRKWRRSGSDSTEFVYDVFGNLIRVNNVGHQLDYLVDGLNRRIGYKLDGILQRVWLYQDERRPIAEVDRAGNIVNRYVYGSQHNVPDMVLRASGGYRVISDYLGNVRALVDTASGTSLQRIDYDAWGQQTQNSAPGVQMLGFAGGLTDTATTLVRFGARDYVPEVGRWTGKDQIRFRGGSANLYAYVHNRPTTLVDPDGYGHFEDVPLDWPPVIIPWPGALDLLADLCGCEVKHENYVFDDGKTFGMFNDAGSWPFGQPYYGPDPSGKRGIRSDPVEYDDDMMRDAINRTLKQMKGVPYLLLGWNCQTFTSLLRFNYQLLSAGEEMRSGPSGTRR